MQIKNKKDIMIPGNRGIEDLEKSYVLNGEYYCKYFKLYKYSKNKKFDKGDKIVGYIKLIKDKIIIIQGTSNYTKGIKINKVFLLFISEIASEYVENIKDFYSENDTVLFEIVDSKEEKITTKKDDLGVINTNCKFCNFPILKILPGNKCNNCKLTNNKKFSAIYNTIYSKL